MDPVPRPLRRGGAIAIDTLELLKTCWNAAEERKAEEIVCLELKGLSTIADYFLFCNGNSDPHLKAIRDSVERSTRAEGRRARAVDGFPESRWIVIDYGDLVVHIFHPETRSFYALEDLWSDAARWTPDGAPEPDPDPADS